MRTYLNWFGVVRRFLSIYCTWSYFCLFVCSFIFLCMTTLNWLRNMHLARLRATYVPYSIIGLMSTYCVQYSTHGKEWPFRRLLPLKYVVQFLTSDWWCKDGGSSFRLTIYPTSFPGHDISILPRFHHAKKSTTQAHKAFLPTARPRPLQDFTWIEMYT